MTAQEGRGVSKVKLFDKDGSVKLSEEF